MTNRLKLVTEDGKQAARMEGSNEDEVKALAASYAMQRVLTLKPGESFTVIRTDDPNHMFRFPPVEKTDEK